jgi:hypothetical protein
MIRLVEKVKLMRSLQEISKNLTGNKKIEIPSCELILVSPMCSQSADNNEDLTPLSTLTQSSLVVDGCKNGNNDAIGGRGICVRRLKQQLTNNGSKRVRRWQWWQQAMTTMQEERDATAMTTADWLALTTSNNQPKKSLWLGLRGGGTAEGEGTNPMQDERITTAMTNDWIKNQWHADNDDNATPSPASTQSKKAADRLTTQQPRETVTTTTTKPLEATRNNNQQTMGAKNEEAVMMVSDDDSQCGVRWTQQRQHRMQQTTQQSTNGDDDDNNNNVKGWCWEEGGGKLHQSGTKENNVIKLDGGCAVEAVVMMRCQDGTPRPGWWRQGTRRDAPWLVAVGASNKTTRRGGLWRCFRGGGGDEGGMRNNGGALKL